MIEGHLFPVAVQRPFLSCPACSLALWPLETVEAGSPGGCCWEGLGVTCSLVGLRVRGEGSTAEDRCVFGKKGQWEHDPKVFAPAPGPVVSVSGGRCWGQAGTGSPMWAVSWCRALPVGAWETAWLGSQVCIGDMGAEAGAR